MCAGGGMGAPRWSSRSADDAGAQRLRRRPTIRPRSVGQPALPDLLSGHARVTRTTSQSPQSRWDRGHRPQTGPHGPLQEQHPRPGVQPVVGASPGEGARRWRIRRPRRRHRPREMLSEAARWREGPVAESFAESDRHPPTFDPATHSVTLPGAVHRVPASVGPRQWFRIDLRRGRRRRAGTGDGELALNELPLGAQPAVFIYLAGPVLADILPTSATKTRSVGPQRLSNARWGRHHGAHRTRCGLGRRRRPTKAIEQPDGTLASTASLVHHQRRRGVTCSRTSCTRPGRPEGAGPAHQGPEPVSWCPSSCSTRDRRARPTQRRVPSPTSNTRWGRLRPPAS